jgi:hypothetical protein
MERVRLPDAKRGQRKLDLEAFNDMQDVVEALSRPIAGQGIVRSVGTQGVTFSATANPGFRAKITAADGSTPPKHSWTEQQENGDGTFSDLVDARMGTPTIWPAYSPSGAAVAVGSIVRLLPGKNGDYYVIETAGGGTPVVPTFTLHNNRVVAIYAGFNLVGFPSGAINNIIPMRILEDTEGGWTVDGLGRLARNSLPGPKPTFREVEFGCTVRLQSADGTPPPAGPSAIILKIWQNGPGLGGLPIGGQTVAVTADVLTANFSNLGIPISAVATYFEQSDVPTTYCATIELWGGAAGLRLAMAPVAAPSTQATWTMRVPPTLTSP